MATTKHAVVRTDNMAATDVRSLLVSLRYIKEEETPTEIDNGNVLKVGDLIDGERELHEGSDVTASDSLDDVVLIASPEVMYDERIKNLDEYYNVAGKDLRGYRFHTGDIFSLTKEAFADETEPTVGNIVELAAGTKLKAVGTATSGSTQVGKVIEKEIVGRYTFYAILVTSAKVASEAA